MPPNQKSAVLRGSVCAANLRRLMARHGLTVAQVAQHSVMDRRTVKGILHGSTKPHSRSLQKLAMGLRVSTDELFLEPSLLVQRKFDRRTNPAIDEVVSEHSDLFQGWTPAEFDELYSRVGTGGGLTTDGAIDAVREINRKREVLGKVEVLLESSQADVLRGIIEVLHRSVQADGS